MKYFELYDGTEHTLVAVATLRELKSAANDCAREAGFKPERGMRAARNLWLGAESETFPGYGGSVRAFRITKRQYDGTSEVAGACDLWTEEADSVDALAWNDAALIAHMTRDAAHMLP